MAGGAANTLSRPGPQESTWKSIILVLLTGSVYIALSAGLIAFNKHLMSPGRFPFPAALGLMHTCFCSLMAMVLYLAKPDLFTSLTDPVKKIDLRDGIMFKAVLPIAVCFTIQICLSNQVYLFADISFIQMLKEANVVLVFLMSIAFALEVFKWRLMNLICLIVLATWMTISGELHFSWVALFLQGSCCFIESSKITLQGLLLSRAGKGLDAMSYMLVVMPICACMFGALVVLLTFAWPHQAVFPMPTMEEWLDMRWMLAANTCVACMLNLSSFVFIGCSSAVAFVLAGILKDVFIVVIGVIFMGHETTVLQAIGFTLQVSLILVYSLMKTFPKEFANGITDGMVVLVLGKSSESLEVPAHRAKDYGSDKDSDGRLTTCSFPEPKDSRV